VFWSGVADLRVPFLYASNGEIIWHLDVRPGKLISRQIKGFHSAEALKWLFEHDLAPAIDWLVGTPPERIGRLRPYQKNCILAVEKEIIGGRRDLLVAMATGTGKTFLTVAQIYRLLESKLVRKILFLDKLDIPIYAFDLIVADECHRGYSAQELSIWRDTLLHFDAIRVGLTATPAAHTVALFGEPVFRYGVDEYESIGGEGSVLPFPRSNPEKFD
jgi:type I site-specific restriction endonuclease